ncbi:MAG: hypothetical protein JOZ01_02945, partial [Candidatus Eremiobacteraeota bacterium]|nr:hypothetical protein [Candidatus Eremiobacteraeota bacterium]
MSASSAPAATLGIATLLLLAQAGATPTSPDAGAESALRDAVRTLATERQGVSAFHRHVVGQQRAPGHDKSLDLQSGLLRDGDSVIAVKVYSQITNGKTASANDLAKAQVDA